MSILGAVGSAIGGAVGNVLKCVTGVVDEVVGQLGQQQGMIDELVQSPIKSMMDQVADGMWVGPGADAFVGECQGTFIPNSQQITEGIGGLMGGITAAVDLVEEADKKAATMVNDLATEFGNIYKGS
jgi:hypothetical protein